MGRRGVGGVVPGGEDQVALGGQGLFEPGGSCFHWFWVIFLLDFCSKDFFYWIFAV